MNKILDVNKNGNITILKAELDLSDNCYDFDKVEMKTYNIFDLINQLKQRDEVIDQIYNFVNHYRHYTEIDNKDYLKDKEHYGYLDKWQTDDLLEILQIYKGDNK